MLRSSNLEDTLSFYSALGLNFIQEQHGSGPLHYSCDLGGLVLEIYLGQAGMVPEPKATGSTMLGCNVVSLDETLECLQALDIEPKSAPKDAEWGRWINVVDPDGRVIQLNQLAK
ncbi:MAG: VOC family protein [Cyanobacteria bacterium P01_D01_bin.1]